MPLLLSPLISSAFFLGVGEEWESPGLSKVEGIAILPLQNEPTFLTDKGQGGDSLGDSLLMGLLDNLS